MELSLLWWGLHGYSPMLAELEVLPISGIDRVDVTDPAETGCEAPPTDANGCSSIDDSTSPIQPFDFEGAATDSTPRPAAGALPPGTLDRSICIFLSSAARTSTTVGSADDGLFSFA